MLLPRPLSLCLQRHLLVACARHLQGSWSLSPPACWLCLCPYRFWRILADPAASNLSHLANAMPREVWRLVKDIRQKLGADTKKVDVYTYTQGGS